MARLRVWDLPTRLLHWLLVIAVVGLIVTGNLGGAWMTSHFRLGYAVLALLLFRLAWGFVGGYWSRFSRFIYSPLTLLRYLRGQSMPEHELGHSPTAALSVFALLLVLSLQVVSGLLSDDEIAFTGPLSRFAPSEWVPLATAYHAEWGKLVLIGLVVLHLLAIGYYKWIRKTSLVAAMITGDKTTDLLQPASRDGLAQRVLALLLAIGCVAIAAFVASL
ncbi:cytochrome B [Malikia spinosa]|uniref:Cytochrome B n=1 Tax=Malikia spinosa TaxID=86180 RepID=A0A2S9KEK7_9BURK|nr:cytochrome b/b6 domain-containing protein [Malikia spinosa]PRD68873.1 cytochrome B [Malikia spinosa]